MNIKMNPLKISFTDRNYYESKKTKLFGRIWNAKTGLVNYLFFVVFCLSHCRLSHSLAVNLACGYGNDDCVNNATQEFAAWMANPETNP